MASDSKVRLVYNLNGKDGAGKVLGLGGEVNMKDAVATVNNWKLLYLDFTVPADYISDDVWSNDLRIFINNAGSTRPAYVDDMRLHPIDAAMTSYVYDDNTGLVTHILDGNNYYTRYEYDAKNRLKATYRESSKGVFKVKEYNYHTYDNQD